MEEIHLKEKENFNETPYVAWKKMVATMNRQDIEHQIQINRDLIAQANNFTPFKENQEKIESIIKGSNQKINFLTNLLKQK